MFWENAILGKGHLGKNVIFVKAHFLQNLHSNHIFKVFMEAIHMKKLNNLQNAVNLKLF